MHMKLRLHRTGAWIRYLLLLACIGMCSQAVTSGEDGVSHTMFLDIVGVVEYDSEPSHATPTYQVQTSFTSLDQNATVTLTVLAQFAKTPHHLDSLDSITKSPLSDEAGFEHNIQPSDESNNMNNGALAEQKADCSDDECDDGREVWDGCNRSDLHATPLCSLQANTTSNAEAIPLWRHIMDAGVLCVGSIGVIANAMTFVTMTVNGRAFSRLTVVLLKHQAIVDMAVCACGSAVFVQRSVHHMTQYTIDYVICYIWYSQTLYWATVLVSVYNLVFIAFDRLVAVCFPVKYKTMSPKNLKIAIAIGYVPCICSAAPCVELVSFVKGQCILGMSLPPDLAYKFYYGYSIHWLFVAYIIPVASFFIFYGRVVVQLRRHRKAITSAIESQALTKSTVRVTNCLITVTAVFIVTVSYHSIYFCAGSVGLMSFDLGGPTQLIGILLTVCNSCANPFMYAMFMPAFRRSLRATIWRKSNAVQDEPTVETPGSTV